MIRNLDPKFVNDLLSGSLKPLLQKIKDDNTLVLEIRGNYINIYYNGGMVLRVTPFKSYEQYKFEWDIKYAKGSDLSHLKLREIRRVSNSIDCKKWITIIPELKGYMNGWFKKEKYIQQAIVEKGVLPGYLLTDFEYQKGNRARFDLMGIKMTDNNPMLSFIELKQGYSSLRTKVNAKKKKTSGLKKHLEDIIEEITNKNEIEKEIRQAQNLFDQKKKLGLPSNYKFPLKINNDEIEVLFVIADYQTPGSNRYSEMLGREILDIEDYMNSKSLEFKLHINIMFLQTDISNQEVKIMGSSEIDNYSNYKALLKQLYH